MRIISILVALPMLFVTLVPQSALASKINTDETKINFEIKDHISLSNLKSSNIPYNYPGYKPFQDKDELERDAKLRKRYAHKLDLVVYPRGEFTVNASAYTAAADECGKSDGITASGLKVKEGRTIACPPNFPLGTKIKIKGMGTYTCEDRGGAIKGNHIDIYVQTKKEAFAFGRRNLIAEVVQ
jgi:3D (Asp-Asp-Asp) domain-containing protein